MNGRRNIPRKVLSSVKSSSNRNYSSLAPPMSSSELNNLVRTKDLKVEPGDQKEFDGLLVSARARLADAQRADLALESRFDLAYNAAHALSLAAVSCPGHSPVRHTDNVL